MFWPLMANNNYYGKQIKFTTSPEDLSFRDAFTATNLLHVAYLSLQPPTVLFPSISHGTVPVLVGSGVRTTQCHQEAHRGGSRVRHEVTFHQNVPAAFHPCLLQASCRFSFFYNITNFRFYLYVWVSEDNKDVANSWAR